MGTTTDNVSPQPASEQRSSKTEYGIVVGIDGSGGSLHALRWAARRAAQFGSLQPVMTWQHPWWAYSSPVPPPVDDFQHQAAQAAERALAEARGVTTLTPLVCRGHAGQTLVDVGASANMIVVGTRGRGGVADTLLGSVSSFVVANATVPVAVVPADAPTDEPPKRVVVGVDGSANGRQALVWALKHVPADATIEAVHTWIYPTDPTIGQTITPFGVYEDRAKYLLDEEIRAATEAAGRDEADLPTVVKRVESGDARAIIGELSTGCDLLVLGARGRGGIAHLLLGSVTTALVHRPATTTIVVPVVEH